MRFMILDANVASQVFRTSAPEFKPIRVALFEAKPRPWGVAHGGKLTAELNAVDDARRALAQLDRAGRVAIAPSQCMAVEERALSQGGLCRSNDVHVLAVARCSAARLLCTLDEALAADFTNPQLISKPRGKVYQNTAHARLLLYRERRGRRGG